VEQQAVIEEVDKEFSIYEVPLGLVEHKLDKQICDKLGLNPGALEMGDWRELIHRIRNPKHEVQIAVVGKYIEHSDAYKSIYESMDHAGFSHETRVLIKRVEAEELDQKGADMLLRGVDGILVPGGFGMRGIEGKIQAVQYARENKIPYFGICLGMQCAVIEFARNVLGLTEANSTEFAGDSPDPVICLLEEQKEITDMGGTMRLGGQVCRIKEASLAHRSYQNTEIKERHRHRYEFNSRYLEQFEDNGMIASGTNPHSDLVEIVELTGHPWFLAVQFHPEFKSKPDASHPLFRSFIQSALDHHQSR